MILYFIHYSIISLLNGRCDCFKALNVNYKNDRQKQLKRRQLISFYERIKNSEFYNDSKKEKYLKRIQNEIDALR